MKMVKVCWITDVEKYSHVGTLYMIRKIARYDFLRGVFQEGFQTFHFHFSHELLEREHLLNDWNYLTDWLK